MARAQRKPITYDEYHQLEQNSEIRHELVDGVLVAMVGGTDIHNLITGNIMVAFKTRLRGRGCRVFFSDMRLRIGENVRYPDVFVTCAADDDHPHYKTQPIVIAEVLSDSTARMDRGAKFDDYRQLPSLAHYLLISQTAVHVEHFARKTGWQSEVLIHDNLLTLSTLSLSIPITDFYEDIGIG